MRQRQVGNDIHNNNSLSNKPTIICQTNKQNYKQNDNNKIQTRKEEEEREQTWTFFLVLGRVSMIIGHHIVNQCENAQVLDEHRQMDH